MLVAAAAMSSCLLASPSARADLIAPTTDGHVYRINESTGAATEIGNNSGSWFFGISIDSSGTYYANDWGAGYSHLSLTTIDPSTGLKGSDIASGTLALKDIAFSPTDILYAVQDSSGPDQLGTIDTTTGAFTPVGDRVEEYAGGMTFIGSTLYADASGGLSTVDITSGVVTDVNPSVGDGGWTGLAYDGGVLYGVLGNSLYSIDTSTGAETLIGSDGLISGSYNALAPLAAVPEPAMLGLLAPLGLMFYRRRQAR